MVSSLPQPNQPCCQLLQVSANDSCTDLTERRSSAPTTRWFELDAVLDATASQQDVYEHSGTKEAVTQGIFKGYNTTVLAYGQTG